MPGAARTGAPDQEAPSGHALGKPVAEIVSPSPDDAQKDWISSIRDTMEIQGDILSPVIGETDIEALRE